MILPQTIRLNDLYLKRKPALYYRVCKWSDITYQRSFLTDLAKKLHIVDHVGWYTLTCATLRKHGGSRLLEKYNGSPSKLFSTIFPEYPLLLRLHMFIE